MPSRDGSMSSAIRFPQSERAQAVHGESISGVQVVERALDGLPGCVLSKVSAEDDLEGSFGRPPMLGTVGSDEIVVHLAQALGGGESHLLGRTLSR